MWTSSNFNLYRNDRQRSHETLNCRQATKAFSAALLGAGRNNVTMGSVPSTLSRCFPYTDFMSGLHSPVLQRVYMHYCGESTMAMGTGFLLVTPPGLMASSQARKAQPLFHYEVKTFLVRHFGKARTVGQIMGLTAERTVLLRRIGWVCDTTRGGGGGGGVRILPSLDWEDSCQMD